MIFYASTIIGAAYGAFLAKRRGGKGLDMLQYAAGFGILFAIIGLFITLGINRFG